MRRLDSNQPYHVGASAQDCVDALQNILSTLDRNELDGAQYFAEVASFHLSRLKREISLRRRFSA